MTNEELVAEIQQGSNVTNNMKSLYENNLPLIRIIIEKIPHDKQDDEDCLQVAYIGLHKAVQGYKPETGTAFMTYAGFYIRNEVQRSLHGDVPERTTLILQRINKYRAEYVNKYGSEPSREMIQHELKISEQTLKSCLNALSVKNRVSLDTPVSDSESDSISMIDMIPDRNNPINDFIEKSARNEAAAEIWKCVDTLPKDEAETIEGFYKNDSSFRDISKHTGMKYGHVLGCHRRAIKRLSKRREMQKAAKIYDVYGAAFRGSFGSYNRTWTSSTEHAALKLIDIENKYSERGL